MFWGIPQSESEEWEPSVSSVLGKPFYTISLGSSGKMHISRTKKVFHDSGCPINILNKQFYNKGDLWNP